jgi:magnesium-transporting ATPase (P-type)
VRLIPLDVIVNTKISKIIFSKMMQEDVEIMAIDPLQSEDGLLRCKVESLQLPEELGIINHIFRDKTSTLTMNELILRSMSMRGVLMSG